MPVRGRARSACDRQYEHTDAADAQGQQRAPLALACRAAAWPQAQPQPNTVRRPKPSSCCNPCNAYGACPPDAFSMIGTLYSQAAEGISGVMGCILLLGAGAGGTRKTGLRPLISSGVCRLPSGITPTTLRLQCWRPTRLMSVSRGCVAGQTIWVSCPRMPAWRFVDAVFDLAAVCKICTCRSIVRFQSSMITGVES